MQILRNFIFSSNYSRKYEQASAIDHSDVQIQPIHPASTIPTQPHGKVLLQLTMLQQRQRVQGSGATTEALALL